MFILCVIVYFLSLAFDGCSRVVSLGFFALGEVAVAIFGQFSVFEGVAAEVVFGQGVNLDLAQFVFDEVPKRAMLLPRLALIPILNLGEAHARVQLLRFEAVGHSLVEGVTRVCRKVH